MKVSPAGISGNTEETDSWSTISVMYKQASALCDDVYSVSSFSGTLTVAEQDASNTNSIWDGY